MSKSLRPHESQHSRPPCPSPAPEVYSNSCPSSRWCHPAISSSVVPFSNPSQHQGLFQWVNSLHQVAKVLEFQLQSFLPCLRRASLPQVRTIPTLRVQNGNNVNFTEKETETQKNIISSTSHFLGSRHYKKDFTRVISLNPRISLCPPNHPQTW